MVHSQARGLQLSDVGQYVRDPSQRNRLHLRISPRRRRAGLGRNTGVAPALRRPPLRGKKGWVFRGGGYILDDARRERRGHGLAALAHTELLIDVLQVIFDRVIGNVQLGRDFLALEPLRDELEDVELAIGQARGVGLAPGHWRRRRSSGAARQRTSDLAAG